MAVLHKLSALEVRRAKGPCKLNDGGGLVLHVRESGAKSWTFVYRFDGKRPEVGLGSWPEVTLSDARAKAGEARKWLSQTPKRDPRAEWKKKAVAAAPPQACPRFGEFALQFIRDRARGWKHRDSEKQWRNSLKLHARPIWKRPVDAITPADVLACLKPIWYEIPTTAERVRNRIELILDAARAEGLREGYNPATWKGNLQASLPRRKRTETHYPALELSDLPDFWKHLEAQSKVSARCLQFLILTATRSGEARGARWDEIDLEDAIWTVPGRRTKNGETLRVPLSLAAMELLEHMRGLPGGVVFPSHTTFDVMTDRPLQLICRRSGFVDQEGRPITPHGMRATFRTWAEDEIDLDTAERALGHRRPKIVRSYARGDALERRRHLMQAWSEVVSGTPEWPAVGAARLAAE